LVVEGFSRAGEAKAFIGENGIFTSRLWVHGMDLSIADKGIGFSIPDPINTLGARSAQ